MFAIFYSLLSLTLPSAEERNILWALKFFVCCFFYCVSLMFLNYGLAFENWFVIKLSCEVNSCIAVLCLEFKRSTTGECGLI